MTDKLTKSLNDMMDKLEESAKDLIPCTLEDLESYINDKESDTITMKLFGLTRAELEEEDRGTGENVITDAKEAYIRGSNSTFRRIALGLFLEHVDAEIIHNVTGISLERVKELKELGYEDLILALCSEKIEWRS